jgi:hypothetical protein
LAKFSDKTFPRFRFPAFPPPALTFVPWLLGCSKICVYLCLVPIIGSVVKNLFSALELACF